ncbi:MAG: DUF58 domain-containing protein [Acidobacteriota bacterium]
MRSLGSLNWRSVREFFWPSLFLVLALILAVLSSIARQDGQYYAAAFLAIISLGLALVISAILVPKLLVRAKLDFLNRWDFARFTRRGAFFVLIILVIAFATFNTGNNLLILVLSFLLASLIVSGLVSNLVLQKLRISLNVPDGIHAGYRAVFFLTLHNVKKLFPSFALKLKGKKRGAGKQEGTNFFVQEKIFPYIRAGEKVRLSLECEFSDRGIYAIEGFEVTTTFPFGFFWRGRKLSAQGEIFVYPELVDLKSLFLRFPFLQGSQEKVLKGRGNVLYNIRDYQSGDSARSVHWKSTAKLGRLMIKDFSSEEDAPLKIIFSTFLPDTLPAGRRQFEKAVSCICSLARHYQTCGQSFGFDSGEFQISMNGNRKDYELLMEYLTCVQPCAHIQVNSAAADPTAVVFSAGESLQAADGLRIDFLKI